MSEQYPGGFITKEPPTPEGPYETDSAYGIWNLSQQAAYQAQGLWPTAGSLPPDAQFNYVTMLLHGDGTNGAQNNTFLDSSTNNFTITRNGNTTQGSFSPYGDNWSNYFDGSGDWLNTASTSAVAFGTGDFTLEAWVYPSANQTGYRGVLSAYDGDGPVIETYGNYWAYFFTGSGVATSTLVVPNTWTHVALTRSGTTGRMFVNGVLAATVSDSTNYSSNSTVTVGALGGGLDAGYEFNGYISNARIVKGTAVYTSAFTPPTAPLTAISGTSFLGCQSNRFIDNSASPLTITVNGNPSVQRFNPFGTSTAYSTATIGGSGYFGSANGNSLTIPTITFSGNCTLETWIYPTAQSSSGYSIIFNAATTPQIYYYTDGRVGCYFSAGANGVSSTGKLKMNAWSHLAVVRNGSTIDVYVNGVGIGLSLTYSSSFDITQVGSYYDNTYNVYGYLSDVRLGTTAVYTSSFTPPTAPLTAVANTQLLCNMTNAAIYDNAMMNDLETVGDAQISTSVKKYGTGSLAFDGTGDSLKGIAGSPSFQFGTGDFTIEMWVYTSNLAAYQTLLDTRAADSTTAYGLFIDNTGKPYWFDASGTQASSVGVSSNTWTHIAFVRTSGVLKIFVNGTSGYSSANTNSQNPTGNIVVGMNISGSAPYNGYIDDLRITKGYARYTTTFTPPTAAFPNIGPT